MHKEEERQSMNVQAGRGWCMVGKKAEWVKAATRKKNHLDRQRLRARLKQDAELSLFHSSGA